ncbi:MAG: hypothetical protein ACOCZB_03820 [Spirochaetota bacterium]
MIRLSCASLSFDGFGDEDFVHTFAKVNEAGYRHLEFNCWYPRTLTPAKMRDLAERTRVEALLIAGEAAWCPIVELELCKGARGDREIAVIRQMADILVSLDIDRDVWSTANVMARTSREHGDRFGYRRSRRRVREAARRSIGAPRSALQPHQSDRAISSVTTPAAEQSNEESMGNADDHDRPSTILRRASMK